MFLIQTTNNEISFDFQFQLIQAIKYNRWYLDDKNIYPYKLINRNNTSSFGIPIGSVEFVLEYFKSHYNFNILPKNIPKELLNVAFTKRNIYNKKLNHNFKEYKFIKSNTQIKGIVGVARQLYGILGKIPPDEYQISDIITIESEWRCFIYNNKLQYLSNYDGAVDIFPNIKTIRLMIDAYKEVAPIAYTLDVGINDSGTFIIEVHDFFSCGLYGFTGYRILPQMFINWNKEFLTKNKLSK